MPAPYFNSWLDLASPAGRTDMLDFLRSGESPIHGPRLISMEELKAAAAGADHSGRLRVKTLSFVMDMVPTALTSPAANRRRTAGQTVSLADSAVRQRRSEWRRDWRNESGTTPGQLGSFSTSTPCSPDEARQGQGAQLTSMEEQLVVEEIWRPAGNANWDRVVYEGKSRLWTSA